MSFSIDNFNFTKNSPVFIIAELSANHNGSLDNAIATIKAAKKAGANAIKFQTYTADTITLNVKTSDFKITQGTIWDGNYLYDLYKEAYTPWEWHAKLFQVAKVQWGVGISDSQWKKIQWGVGLSEGQCFFC